MVFFFLLENLGIDCCMRLSVQELIICTSQLLVESIPGVPSRRHRKASWIVSVYVPYASWHHVCWVGQWYIDRLQESINQRGGGGVNIEGTIIKSSFMHKMSF